MSFRTLLLCAVGALAFAASVSAKPVIGDAAPAFSLAGADGREHALADYRGRIVVLEWHNPECPFVKKHYAAGNLPRQQADALASGAVWLTINSAAPGKQGELDAANANAWLASQQARPRAYLFDRDGSVGRAYAAKTTPHLYVIDREGMLRYAGGIDSIASADADDIAAAVQYVPQVLAELAAGKAVSVPTSEPYGCSVKYGS